MILTDTIPLLLLGSNSGLLQLLLLPRPGRHSRLLAGPLARVLEGRVPGGVSAGEGQLLHPRDAMGHSLSLEEVH